MVRLLITLFLRGFMIASRPIFGPFFTFSKSMKYFRKKLFWLEIQLEAI